MSAVTLDPGVLDRRIRIDQRASTQDTFGQRTTTWTQLLTCWARIEQLQGRELQLAQAINAEITHRVVIRYRAGITPAMRAVYQGRYFNVQAVIDVETAHVKLHLYCNEGPNEG